MSTIPCGDAPLVADLREGGAIGIVGPREQSLALARSLVLQAATHTGPADMTIAVCADSARSQDVGVDVVASAHAYGAEPADALVCFW